MKKCSDCKEVKPLTEFHKNRARKDGHQHVCKLCKAGRSKEHQRTYRTQSVYGTTKHRARARLWKRVHVGKLPPVESLSCAACGSPAASRHHLDYVRDIYVELCASCHGIAHSGDCTPAFTALLWQKGKKL